MLLWVSGERRHEERLKELISDAPAIDPVLQDSIAFLFLAPEGLATAIRDGSVQNARFFSRLNRPEILHDKKRYEAIARHTRENAWCFAEVFKIRPGELPCLVTLIRGVDAHIIAPMGERLSLREIRGWLTSLAEVVRRHQERSVIPPREDLGAVIHTITTTNLSLEADMRKFREAVDGLAKRHPAFSDVGAGLIHTAIQSARFDPLLIRDELHDVVRFAKEEGHLRLLHDQRIQKLEKILNSIETKETQVAMTLDHRRPIELAYNQYQESLSQLERDVVALSGRLHGSHFANAVGITKRLAMSAPRWLDVANKMITAMDKFQRTFT
jgi:hypothetical protein